MADYIERGKVLEMLSAAGVYCDTDDAWDAVEIASRWIEEKIPAADVRPERHGVWVDFGRDNDYYHYFRCSECSFEIGQSLSATKQNKFCSNCGAKMDGKDSENNE